MSKWVDFTAIRGDKMPTMRFSFLQNDGETPYDLTDYKATLTLKKFIDDLDTDINAIKQYTIDPIPAPTLGVVDFQISGADVNELSGYVYWDMQLVNTTTGEPTTPYIGKILFVRDVTRGV